MPTLTAVNVRILDIGECSIVLISTFSMAETCYWPVVALFILTHPRDRRNPATPGILAVVLVQAAKVMKLSFLLHRLPIYKTHVNEIFM
jgi:hypothetical protein